MRPSARVQAAIEILDAVIGAAREGGAAADTILARYFAARRYAGAKDRRAVRDLVYRASTEPDLLIQWLGPSRFEMSIDAYDVRAGGRWRYVHRDADGNEFGFHGVFHGDPSPDGMVQTFEFEGAPGHVSLETLVLAERDGRSDPAVRLAQMPTFFSSRSSFWYWRWRSFSAASRLAWSTFCCASISASVRLAGQDSA